MVNRLRCKIDGNCLCIEGKDFINLQESDAYFIELSDKILKEVELFFDNNKVKSLEVLKINKIVRQFGNSGHILVPKEWINKNVILQVVD